MDNKKTFLSQGKMKRVGAHEKPDYTFMSGADFLSGATNLIPGVSGVSGGRVMLGDKASIQAISLINREAPLVQAVPHKDSPSFEQYFGKSLIAIHSPINGTVESVHQDSIELKDNKGEPHTVEIYSNFNSGKKSFIDHTPVVKKGDEVKKGQLLATSNFSDDKGNLALGVNLKTAIMPYRSNNFEDAFVVTESGAKKLVAQQLVNIKLERRLGVDTNKDKYISLFANKFYNDQLNNIDSDGVVKKGTILKMGDPIILAFAPKALKTTDMHLGKLSKALGNAFRDLSEVWEYETDGEVTDVSKAGALLSVNIKLIRNLNVGDKLSIYSGNKGVTGLILPDHLAPQTKDGKPIHLLLNSMSVTSRVSPAMLSNLGLGKVAEKTGKPIKITGFVDGSSIKKTQALMAKHDIPDLEEVYDPVSGTHTKVLVGPLFINRLVHIAEDKLSDRSQGVGYDWDCLDANTKILTRTGWKSYDQLADDDLFFTVDQDNNIQYQKAAKIIIRDHAGDMYGFKSKYLDYLVTPNHRMYVAKEGAATSFKFTTAEECFNTRFSVQQFGFKYNGTKQDIDYAELYGWWISEGSIKPQCIHIYQSSSANPEKFERIEALLKKLNISFTYYKRKEEKHGFRINDKNLVNYLLTKSGTSKYTKRIPREIFELDLESRFAFLTAAIKGDGTEYIHKKNSSQRIKENKITQYFTCNKGLADDIQELCISVGWGAFISSRPARKNKFKCGRMVNSGINYTVGITKERNRSTVRNYKNSQHYKTYYTGKVFCVTLPETGLIYVKRNDKPMLIGNCQPTKAKDESAKRLGNLSTSALLSHGATEVLKDIAVVRATKNDEFWRNIKMGLPAPAPKVPFIFNKFISSLNAAGINVKREGDNLQILPLTDKDTEAVSAGPIANAKTFKVKGQNLIPEKGGLFDPANTGILGTNFNHINLHAHVPNPISEDPLRRMLKMTKEQYEAGVANGEVQKSIMALDIDKKIAEYKAYLRTGKISDRNNAVKVLSFLITLKKNGMHPKDLILTKLPVLPAQYRPVQVAGELTLSANVNNLYKDLILNNEKIPDLKYVPDEIADKVRRAQYDGVKAVYGLGDPISVKNKEKSVKGLLAEMLGTHGGSAKISMFQAKVVNKPLDLISRSVATGDVKLGLDQISLPQDILWKIYSPFVIRRLARRGVPVTQSHEYVKNRNPMALQALQDEMDDRPVTMSRDPALHKFNLMGFLPKMNPDPKNKTVSVNPLVFKGFNLDLDGDQISVGIPASDAAKEEIKNKMLPSRNLLTVRGFSPLYTPSNEAALGLYQMSTEQNNNEPIHFKTEADAISAFNAGKVSVGDRVVIGN